MLHLDLGKVLHLSTYSRSAVTDNMVLNVPFFFGIHSIGVACFAPAGTHHPAVVYCSIFRVSSERNASGHLGNLCLSCFDSSIKGISCDTS